MVRSNSLPRASIGASQNRVLRTSDSLAVPLRTISPVPESDESSKVVCTPNFVNESCSLVSLAISVLERSENTIVCWFCRAYEFPKPARDNPDDEGLCDVAKLLCRSRLDLGPLSCLMLTSGRQKLFWMNRSGEDRVEGEGPRASLVNSLTSILRP